MSAPGNTLGVMGLPPSPSPFPSWASPALGCVPLAVLGAGSSPLPGPLLSFGLRAAPLSPPALSQVGAVFFRTFQLVDYPHRRRLRTSFPSRAGRVEGPVEDELASSQSGPGSLMAKGGGVSRWGGVRF